MRIFIPTLFLLALPAVSNALINADFEAEAGAWQDRQGPPGWELRLGSDEQFGIVEDIDFAHTGSRAFYFSQVARGFGDSRLEQCVAISDPFALRLSVQALTDEPHPELALRLRMDFYADGECDQDSANADAEQIQTDIGLSPDRTPAGQWTRLESATRLGSALGSDVGSVRISIRQRDRSADGNPRNPPRTVWIDSVVLDAGDVVVLPGDQRQALRDLYLALDGANWRHQLGWMNAEGTECRWQGVRCNAAGDSVVGLDLSANRLVGELPASLTSLTDLDPLGGLDLCWNDVLVPDDIQSFVANRHLGGDPGFCQGIEPEPLQRAMSGHFYQPLGRNGEGIMLHMLSEGSAVVYWATHNDQGEPLWLTGTARGRDRVLRFNDLWYTNRPGGVQVERAGRASLVFVADQDQPSCASAMLRFSLDGADFGAAAGRELLALDGIGGCQRPSDQDPVIMALEGHWFDPSQGGEGISLTPYGSSQVLVNWFSYDEDGEQIWKIGAGVRDGEQIEFGRLIGFAGGNFNDFLSPDMLTIVPGGLASMVRNAENWLFSYQPDDEPLRELILSRVEAGPDLLASTGVRMDLEMAPEDLELLYSRSPLSDERLPGRVRFNGSDEIQELTGLRFRGGSSRWLPKKSFNVRFEQSQDLLFGSDRMNINAMYTDPTMMREQISFEMFRKLDMPASQTRYFDLWINGIYEGTYIHIQRVDEWLLSNNGLNPDGTLVRDQFRGNPALPGSAFAYDYGNLDQDARLALISDNFDFRGDPSWVHLDDFIQWVRATPAGPDFATGFEQRVAIDNFIDWLLVHWLIGDVDSWGDDYWLYLDHDDPDARWHFIPWDKDLALGSHFRDGFFTDNDFFAYEYPLRGGWDNLMIAKVLATPSLADVINQRLVQLMDEYFPPSWFDERTEVLAELLEDSVSIAPSAMAFQRHDKNHHGLLGRYREQVESVRDFVRLRYAFIERQLAGENSLIEQAERLIPTGSSGLQLLTDDTGFSLGAVKLEKALDRDVTLTIKVEPIDPESTSNVSGINREWTLDSDATLEAFRLILFYRNDVEQFWPSENWYTGGLEPIGQQDQLAIHISDNGMDWEPLPTRVNTYSNRAEAGIDLLPAGSYRLRLLIPQPND